jgi:4-hydroxy-3-methylbut-2-enyl diphosphate reductase
MTITIDPRAGFCPGVRRAISLAEENLKTGPAWCLGEMVHNRPEVERLAGLGLRLLERTDQEAPQAALLMIRAHGEPPSTYRQAREKGYQIVDGTCPIVKKLQEKIRRAAEIEPGALIVIAGKKDIPKSMA